MEGEVGYLRRNHLVPVPAVRDAAELDERLLRWCREGEGRRLEGREPSVGEAMLLGKPHLLPLAAEGFDLREMVFPAVDAKGCVKVRASWYSAPLPPGVTARVEVSAGWVEVFDGGRSVARHARSYGHGQRRLELEHYLDVLHRKLGALAWDAASQALRHALALDPQNPRVPNALAYVYSNQGNPDGAIAVLRTYLAGNIGTDDIHVKLAGLLMTKKRYADAASVLSSAPAAAASPQVQIALGEASLKLGRKVEAEAALTRAVTLKPSSDFLNIAAYQLAEHNLDLTQAHAFAVRALASYETEMDPPGHHPALALQASNAAKLGAIWDTLGWVDFKQGDLKQAVAYIAAAWDLDRNPIEAGASCRRLHAAGAPPRRWAHAGGVLGHRPNCTRRHPPPSR